MPIDTSLDFVPINIAVITISDSRTKENDTSGDTLEKRITDAGHKMIKRTIIPDDVSQIKDTLDTMSKEEDIDCIITTGGTGLTGRDTTPEAVKAIASKHIDGFGELFRQVSFEKIGTSAIQSRAVAALINSTYVFCLPGSTGACKDGWDEILQYQLDIRHKPCNFVEIMPRLNEK
ncbi:molybdenum cofactor biosynthesis protein B [Pelagibacteraceae bacterium]|nr:molybdenum cofactor biosynthesis protein B [Pelagibacteraceae bacterium]